MPVWWRSCTTSSRVVLLLPGSCASTRRKSTGRLSLLQQEEATSFWGSISKVMMQLTPQERVHTFSPARTLTRNLYVVCRRRRSALGSTFSGSTMLDRVSFACLLKLPPWFTQIVFWLAGSLAVPVSGLWDRSILTALFSQVFLISIINYISWIMT